MRLLPIGLDLPEPAILGRYGFAPGVPAALERLINQFSGMVGFGVVPVNDDFDRFDAERVLKIQRYLFERFTCDATARKAALDKLHDDLDQASLDAAEEEGIVVTPEMMWVSDRAGAILDKLPKLHAQILAGEMKPCAGVMTTKSWLVLGGVFVGAYFLFGHK